MSTTRPVNDTRAPRSTAAARMAASRARQRCGSVLVRVEVSGTVIDGLVSAGVLSETERTDRAAIQRAVTDVLNALPPPAIAPQPVVPRTAAELNVARLAAARKIRMGIATP
jgi:hypothetical protein